MCTFSICKFMCQHFLFILLEGVSMHSGTSFHYFTPCYTYTFQEENHYKRKVKARMI